jgi:urea transport system permease protein
VGAALGAFVVNYAKTLFTGGLIAPFWLFGVGVFALAAFLVWKSRLPALAGIIGGAALAFAGSFIPGPIGDYAGLIVAAVAFATLILSTRPEAAGTGTGALLVLFFATPFAGIPLALYWLFALGALFVFVTLLMPKGIVGTFGDLYDKYLSRKKPKDASMSGGAAQPSPAE